MAAVSTLILASMYLWICQLVYIMTCQAHKFLAESKDRQYKDIYGGLQALGYPQSSFMHFVFIFKVLGSHTCMLPSH